MSEVDQSQPESIEKPKKTGISRRRFIKYGVAGAGVGGLSLYRFGCYDTRPFETLKNLSPRAAAIMASVVETMLPPNADKSPAQLRLHVKSIDLYLRGFDSWIITQLHALLYGVEHATLFVWPYFRRFSRLPLDERTRYLRGWQVSWFDKCRLGLDSLKTLAFMAYYTTDKAFKSIGYGGPIAPGFKGTAESRKRYDPLLAPAGKVPGFG